jgi:hypothetical protein
MAVLEASKIKVSASNDPLPLSPTKDHFEELEVEDDDGDIVHQMKSKFDQYPIPLMKAFNTLIIGKPPNVVPDKVEDAQSR